MRTKKQHNDISYDTIESVDLEHISCPYCGTALEISDYGDGADYEYLITEKCPICAVSSVITLADV